MNFESGDQTIFKRGKNTLSKITVVYFVMWIFSFLIQNVIFITIVGFFGVVLLVIVAVSIDGLDNEDLMHKVHLETEIKALRKEIDELKNSKVF